MRSNNMPEIIVRDGDAYVHMGSLEDAGQKPLNKPLTPTYGDLQISISYLAPQLCNTARGKITLTLAVGRIHYWLPARYCSESLGILVEALCESKRKS